VNFDLKNPCEHCPFRSNIKGYLNKERVKEIVSSITEGDGTFSCHKHNEFADDDEGGVMETSDSQHCAGALIFLEKQDRPNQMMRIAERLGIYDRKKLNMKAPVFKNGAEMVKANEDRHIRQRKRTRSKSEGQKSPSLQERVDHNSNN
jgi:Family of unknown function (DUF6283)